MELHDFVVDVERFDLKVDADCRQVRVCPFIVLWCKRVSKCDGGSVERGVVPSARRCCGRPFKRPQSSREWRIFACACIPQI